MIGTFLFICLGLITYTIIFECFWPWWLERKEQKEDSAKVGDEILYPRTGLPYKIVSLETRGVTLLELHSRRTISMNMNEMKNFLAGYPVKGKL